MNPHAVIAENDDVPNVNFKDKFIKAHCVGVEIKKSPNDV